MHSHGDEGCQVIIIGAIVATIICLCFTFIVLSPAIILGHWGVCNMGEKPPCTITTFPSLKYEKWDWGLFKVYEKPVSVAPNSFSVSALTILYYPVGILLLIFTMLQIPIIAIIIVAVPCAGIGLCWCCCMCILHLIMPTV